MYDVITCGSGTVDAFADSQSELITIRTAQHSESLVAFPAGSKILVKSLQYSIGGGGTNTAVSFRKHGFKTGWVGCIGNSAHGKLVLDLMKKQKIDFLGHISKTHETGYSFIINALNDDRTILAYKGANNDLSYDKLKKTKLSAKLFYFSSLVGRAYATQKKLAAHAKSKGAMVAFNPSLYQAKEGMKKLGSMLASTDILIFNKEEAEALCGVCNIKEIFQMLHDAGVSVVVITNGHDTVYASDSSYTYSSKPLKVKCVEATGAGDAFASAFVAQFLRSKNISQSLKAGLIQSSSVISHHGAKHKLMSRSELAKKLTLSRIRVKRV